MLFAIPNRSMKTTPLIITASLALFLLAACEEESRPRNPTTTAAANNGTNNYGYVPGDDTATDFVDTAPAPAPTPTPAPDPIVSDQDVVNQSPSTTDPLATTQQPVAPAPEANRDLSYGTPVPGKAGFVTSPHAPYAGYVDVRGFPPNTEVKDPYSGKIFLVP